MKILKRYSIIISLLVTACFSINKEEQIEVEKKYDPTAISYNNRGVSKFIHSEMDSAIYYYDLAIAQDESYYLPHSNKGQIYLIRKHLDSALTEYNIASKLAPETAEVIAINGMLYDYMGKESKAKIIYQKTIELYTKRIQNWNGDDFNLAHERMNRAVIYMLLGEHLTATNELMDIKPEFAKKGERMEEMIEDLIDFDKNKFLTEFLGLT